MLRRLVPRPSSVEAAGSPGGGLGVLGLPPDVEREVEAKTQGHVGGSWVAFLWTEQMGEDIQASREESFLGTSCLAKA